MPPVFSDAWARAWGEAINQSEAYREAAATWEGPIAAVANEPDGRGDLAVYLDVWHGECRAARSATEMDLAEAAYLLEACPSDWRQLFEGRVAPVMALLTGKLRVSRGPLAGLLPYAPAAKELMRLAAGVETEFPEGW